MLILCLILKMLNIENNLILEYNYTDEGIIMKIIIYLESKEKLIYQLKDNYSLDIYKNLTKEALYYGEKEEKFIASDGGKVENINMKIMNAINSDLNKHNRKYNTKFHLQKFKCIGKEKDILIYLVKFNDEVKLNNFIKLDESNILYKKTNKIIINEVEEILKEDKEISPRKKKFEDIDFEKYVTNEIVLKPDILTCPTCGKDLVKIGEKIRYQISSESKVVESLTMQTNELTAFDNVQSIVKDLGLAYNNDNIVVIKD